MSTAIENMHAREILDSRGHPTLEVVCVTTGGLETIASVPAGASTGAREARELRDGDKARYGGRGVQQAVQVVNEEISPHLAGQPVTEQQVIDDALIALDGMPDKSRLGANAILGASMAVARAGAKTQQVPLYRYLADEADRSLLPIPSLNVLNGGEHAAWQGADFQEYMIVPHGADTFAEAMRWASEIYHSLKRTLKAHRMTTGVGDEGGFAPAVESNQQPLDWLMESIDATGLRLGDDVGLAIDAAASGFWRDGYYQLVTEDRALTADELIEYYADLVSDYPIIILEDGLQEDDWSGWHRLTRQLGDRVTLVGDDIFVTQQIYIERGISESSANAVLVKLNQVGTVSQTRDAVRIAHGAGWHTMVSHRSGETTDDFIADLAVAVGSRYIKSGAPARGERVAKYNRLMAIEAELGKAARLAG